MDVVANTQTVGHLQHPPAHRLLRLHSPSLSSAIHCIAGPALLISHMRNMHHYKYMSDQIRTCSMQSWNIHKLEIV